MAISKPQAYAPTPTGDTKIDDIQDAVKQTTQAVRALPSPRQTVKSLAPNNPDGGVLFKPGQIVDIPHQLGRVPAGFNIAKVVGNRPGPSGMPSQSPNIEMIPVAGPLGQRIMRLRYIAPTSYNPTTGKNEASTDPVRLHLELF